jgi:hypothetical protein
MRNLNEEIKNIKRLITLTEQCGSDLNQCETDLEGKGYTVYAPTEKKDICDENPTIKCVYNILTANGVSDLIINSTKSSSKDCYVLAKSVLKEGGLPKYHFTFYADGQVYLSFKMKSSNNNDKLVYRGQFECDESSNKLTINKLLYQGIWNGSSIAPKNEKVKDASDVVIQVSSTESASYNIPVGDLMYKNVLTWAWNYNVNDNSTILTKIISTLTT